MRVNGTGPFWCTLDSGAGGDGFVLDAVIEKMAGLRPASTGRSFGEGPEVVYDERVLNATLQFDGMRQANPIYTAARVGDALMGWTNKRRWYRSGGGGVAGKLSNWWPNTKPAG